MVIALKAGLAATVTLVCPHCHKPQLRARKPAGQQYACTKCHKRFNREQATPSKARKR